MNVLLLSCMDRPGSALAFSLSKEHSVLVVHPQNGHTIAVSNTGKENRWVLLKKK